VVLQTERLSLRAMTESDLDFLATLLGDPQVMRFYPKPYDREGAAGWLAKMLERYARDGHALWLVEERATGQPIGQIGLLEQEWDGNHDTEVGYLVHHPFWRRGFASEAARACRDHAFRQLKRKRVISLVRFENLPSAAVARSLGMTPIATTVRSGLNCHVFAVSSGQ
jgi:ribosomal-protein-alanine N-acetyltransferase